MSRWLGLSEGGDSNKLILCSVFPSSLIRVGDSNKDNMEYAILTEYSNSFPLAQYVANWIYSMWY